MFDKLKAMGAVANLMKNQEGLKVAAARVREKMENTRVNGEAGSVPPVRSSRARSRSSAWNSAPRSWAG